MTDWNALKERMDAATEGDWQSFAFEYERYVATDEGGYLTDSGICSQVTKPDADFIAHARTDIPEMYALLVEASVAIDAINEAHLRDHGDDMADVDGCETCAELAGLYNSDLIARLPKADR